MKITSMNNRASWSDQLLLVISVWLISSLFFPRIAFAYVDPGSGSVIVTTILGLIAAVSYTFRKYLYKIKRMMFGKKTEEQQNDHK